MLEMARNSVTLRVVVCENFLAEGKDVFWPFVNLGTVSDSIDRETR